MKRLILLTAVTAFLCGPVDAEPLSMSPLESGESRTYQEVPIITINRLGETTRNLTVREGPSMNAAKISLKRYGGQTFYPAESPLYVYGRSKEKQHVAGRNNYWYLVRATDETTESIRDTDNTGNRGWVFGEFIQLDPQAPKAHLTVGRVDLYPIGFSAGGNFAFLRKYDVGGLCGYCPRYDLVIVSAITDEVLFEKTFEALIESNSGTRALTVDELWNRQRAILRDRLVFYDIAAEQTPPFGPVPFTSGGRAYEVEVRTETAVVKWSPWEAPVSMDVEAIASVKILVSAAGVGEKIVHRWERPENGIIATHIAPVAYFCSPFEPRAVMLFERKYMGAENETDDTFVVGVHLERGFQ